MRGVGFWVGGSFRGVLRRRGRGDSYHVGFIRPPQVSSFK